ncbi:unnamed protein product [Rotaria sordida]|uniref:Chitin-binding type-2 domain-containing protein n=1 Tax=Rotaria sordida TaxID=392033 RepID=A0A815JNX8_9BILA|nr:unnamed protein product [Rotaria sordida]
MNISTKWIQSHRAGVLNILSDSTESHILLNIIRQKYASTKPINNFFQYESTIPTSLKTNTAGLHTNINVQLLITKSNSYLYNSDEADNDNQLDRYKRDATSFVCKEDGYYPDPSNCRIYHICTSGIDTTATCAEGTLWDPAKKICGWENTIECKKVTLFANATRVTRKSTTTRSPIKVDSNFTCEYDADGYFPDPKYCHIYHYCGIGVHTVLQCSDNLWFSPISEECEWPDKAKCTAAGDFYTSSLISTNLDNQSERTDSSKQNTPYPPIPCPKGIQEHFRDPYDCSTFHYCNGGVDKSGFCEPGLFWDKKDGYYPDPSNCRIYHICTSGIDTTTTCAEGTLWDPAKKICGWENTIEFFKIGVDKSGFCEPGLFWDKKLGCQWPKDVSNCEHKCPPNGQPLRFVAPDSCCHYYECVNDHLKEKVCPLHKLFSVETKSCEHFQVVKCGARKNCIDSCDYDYSPLCEAVPNCRDRPNGNYADQYRSNCQYHYTCLESRTFNYTSCQLGFRFSVQYQKCLPAKQEKILMNDYIKSFLSVHSCITHIVLKMIAEHFNGMMLILFLDEFNKIQRFMSITDVFDDLIEYITKYAMTIKEIYMNSLLNNDERRNFITKKSY